MTDIVRFLSGKCFRFHAEHGGEKWYVVAEMPNLSPLSYERWADWGPSYRWLLPASAKVQLHYANETHVSEQRVLELESPILAKLRDKYPFHLRLKDANKGMEYLLYLSKDAEVQEVVTKPMKKTQPISLGKIRGMFQSEQNAERAS